MKSVLKFMALAMVVVFVLAGCGKQPTEEMKRDMEYFVLNSAKHFLSEPKWIQRFEKNVQLSPPQLQSRDTFAVWMCEQHNIVNHSIGKPEFPCLLPNLMKRWGPVTSHTVNTTEFI